MIDIQDLERGGDRVCSIQNSFALRLLQGNSWNLKPTSGNTVLTISWFYKHRYPYIRKEPSLYIMNGCIACLFPPCVTFYFLSHTLSPSSPFWAFFNVPLPQWNWDLNSGLCICKAGTLLLEPHLQSILLWWFWRWDLERTICPGWPWNLIHLISVCWVARITGLSHRHPENLVFILYNRREQSFSVKDQVINILSL
jgi:hypothetical protein